MFPEFYHLLSNMLHARMCPVLHRRNTNQSAELWGKETVSTLIHTGALEERG